MKLLAVNGSPRKNRNTATLLKAVTEGAAEAGAETELVHLRDIRFTGCMSCFACKRLGSPALGRCAWKDDLQPVLQKAHEADVLVLGAPIYFFADSALLRSFEERLWFQYARYSTKVRTLAPKKHATALVYTMNACEEILPQYPLMRDVMDLSRANMEGIFSCPCTVFSCCDTRQFDDYSMYDNEMFDPAAKVRRHREVFPGEVEKARALGRQLVS